MSLATRCPQCNSLFKVTSGQLQVHGGQVRCGHCKNVFSGIEHLTSPDTEVWETARIQGDQISETNSIDASVYNRHEQTHNTSFNNQPSFLITNTPQNSRVLQFINRCVAEFAILTPFNKLALLSLVLIATLQTVWLVRKPLSHVLQWPDFHSSGPHTLQAFAIAPSSTLLIEGSALKAMDEHTLQVDITLYNPGRLPSHWPVLKVDLLDSQGLPLASKTLSPSEYQMLVGQSTQVAAKAKPITPKETVEVQAYLNLKELHQHLPEAAATGFRLALFDTL